MQSESVTKRSHGYDVWFAEEHTWTAWVACPAPAELYPGEKGPFRIFDCLQKNLAVLEKNAVLAEKSGFTTLQLNQVFKGTTACIEGAHHVMEGRERAKLIHISVSFRKLLAHEAICAST